MSKYRKKIIKILCLLIFCVTPATFLAWYVIHWTHYPQVYSTYVSADQFVEIMKEFYNKYPHTLEKAVSWGDTIPLGPTYHYRYIDDEGNLKTIKDRLEGRGFTASQLAKGYRKYYRAPIEEGVYFLVDLHDGDQLISYSFSARMDPKRKSGKANVKICLETVYTGDDNNGSLFLINSRDLSIKDNYRYKKIFQDSVLRRLDIKWNNLYFYSLFRSLHL